MKRAGTLARRKAPARPKGTRFPAALRKRAARVRMIGFDSDGTLTDRGMSWDSEGAETRRFDVRDGLAMKWAMQLDFQVVVVSGRRARAVDHRMRELGVPVFQGIQDKVAVLEEFAERHDVAASEVAFVGDDLPDLAALRWCGLPVAVADAHPLIRDAAAWKTPSAGGRGAARETIEAVLDACGVWHVIVDRYGGAA